MVAGINKDEVISNRFFKLNLTEQQWIELNPFIGTPVYNANFIEGFQELLLIGGQTHDKSVTDKLYAFRRISPIDGQKHILDKKTIISPSH